MVTRNVDPSKELFVSTGSTTFLNRLHHSSFILTSCVLKNTNSFFLVFFLCFYSTILVFFLFSIFIFLIYLFSFYFLFFLSSFLFFIFFTLLPLIHLPPPLLSSVPNGPTLMKAKWDTGINTTSALILHTLPW